MLCGCGMLIPVPKWRRRHKIKERDEVLSSYSCGGEDTVTTINDILFELLRSRRQRPMVPSEAPKMEKEGTKQM